jgi:hypothetical protein
MGSGAVLGRGPSVRWVVYTAGGESFAAAYVNDQLLHFNERGRAFVGDGLPVDDKRLQSLRECAPEELPPLPAQAGLWPELVAAVESNGASSQGMADEPALHVSWPVLDDAARHGLAGEILAAIEPHSEADPAALLVTILAAFGAIVGRGPHALADGAEHPARIWPLIVGDTSKSRKGSSWAQVRRVLYVADKSFATERVLGGFGSGESLVDAAAGDDHRLLIVESEYARVLSVCKREGSTLPGILRWAWDGSRLEARSRGATSVADGAHVVVIGHITRAELLARLAESDALGGSLNRFLVVPARRSKLLPSGGNLDDAVVADFGRKFVMFATHARKVGRILRTPAAEDYWSELYERLADDDPGGLLGAVVARDSAQLLRLSVTYALLDKSSRIDVPHIQAAQAVWNYSRAGAALIFGERTGDPIADLILTELQAHGNEGLDGRAVHALLGRNVRAERIEQATDTLIGRGLTNKTNKRTTRRGRPKTVLTLTNKTNKTNKEDDAPAFTDELIDQWAADEVEPIDDELVTRSVPAVPLPRHRPADEAPVDAGADLDGEVNS